jgi:sortase (surface protein transpeptidase)
MWTVVASAVGVVLLAIGVLGFVLAPRDRPGIYLSDSGTTPTSSSVAATTGGQRSTTTIHQRRAAHPRRKPVRRAHRRPAKPPATVHLVPLSVRIPSVGVSSPLVPLGLNPDHTLQVPTDYSVAGWYIYRPVPGQRGPGVLAGHVDSRSGPGVFYQLKDVPIGASIEVSRNDGSVAVFTVTAKEQHSKDAFPTDRVYGPTSKSELRVITCGGAFDSSTRHYEDNIIVFAKLKTIVR